MRLYIDNTSSNVDLISNYNKEDNDNSKKAKHKYHLVEKKEGKFICTYSIRDDGKKVLLNRIPVKDDNTDMVSNKSSKSHSLFNLENSKFCNEAIISTTRASFEFNQKSLKEKYHEKDLKDIMDILTKSI